MLNLLGDSAKILCFPYGWTAKGACSKVFVENFACGVGYHLTPEEEADMEEKPVRLGPREQQIAELLLQGCDNTEIAAQLKMARRTVKAHFNRLFLRFGIDGGIKRVKLATTLYRRQLCLEESATENGRQTNVSSESSSSSPKGSRTAKSQKQSARLSMS
jgi:DNA-binding CsgD family transcriptional regulator